MSCKIGEKTNGACTLDDGEFKGVEYGGCEPSYQTFQKAGQAPWTSEDLKKIEDAYKAFSATPLRICATSEARPSTIGLMAKTPGEIEAAAKIVTDALAVSSGSDKPSIDWVYLGLAVLLGFGVTAVGAYLAHRRLSVASVDAPKGGKEVSSEQPRLQEDRIETQVITLPEDADRFRDVLLAEVANRFPAMEADRKAELADAILRYWEGTGYPVEESGLPPESLIKQGTLDYLDVLAGRDDIRTIDLLVRGMTPVYDPSTGVFSGDIVDAQGNGAYPPMCVDDITPLAAVAPEVIAIPTDGSAITLGKEVSGPAAFQIASDPAEPGAEKIAPEHAQIYVENGALMVHNLSPINGTYVVTQLPTGGGWEYNHSPVAGDGMMLADGDLLRLGDYFYAVSVPEPFESGGSGEILLTRVRDIETSILDIERSVYVEILGELSQKMGGAPEEARDLAAIEILGKWRKAGGRLSEVRSFIAEKIALMTSNPGIGTNQTLMEGPRPVDRLKPRQVDRVTRDFKAVAEEKPVSEKKAEDKELKKR